MKNMIVLHGIGGNPTINWYPYIVEKAKKIGYQVYIPQLPSNNKPNLEITYEFLKKNVDINRETLLIGHSSGASLALGILQKLPQKIRIKRTILIAGFIDANLTPELHKYIPKSDYNDLFPDSWDWEKIKQSSADFIVFYSRSDPFVQARHSEMMKEKLSGTLVGIPNALHFSVTSGGEQFKQFPELLKYL